MREQYRLHGSWGVCNGVELWGEQSGYESDPGIIEGESQLLQYRLWGLWLGFKSNIRTTSKDNFPSCLVSYAAAKWTIQSTSLTSKPRHKGEAVSRTEQLFLHDIWLGVETPDIHVKYRLLWFPYTKVGICYSMVMELFPGFNFFIVQFILACLNIAERGETEACCPVHVLKISSKIFPPRTVRTVKHCEMYRIHWSWYQNTSPSIIVQS